MDLSIAVLIMGMKKRHIIHLLLGCTGTYFPDFKTDDYRKRAAYAEGRIEKFA